MSVLIICRQRQRRRQVMGPSIHPATIHREREQATGCPYLIVA